jgi:dolichyl-phosphate beta-glucosyltransferase
MGTTYAVTDDRTSTRCDAAPAPVPALYDHDLTVVIPAYNEEGRLPWTLWELQRFLDSSGIDYRVMVADDGSSDGTASLSECLGPRFSTSALDRHRGKGAAVRHAMLRATGRVVGFTDADLPYQLGALRQAFHWIDRGECEVVFGARDMNRSVSEVHRRLSRTLATWAFRTLIKRLISRRVTDTQCGLKLFSLRAARAIFSRATIDGFAFDAEVVFLTERLKLPFRRVPVSLVHEYASTLSLARDTLPMVRDVVRLWLRSRRTTAPASDHGRLPALSPESPREVAA